MGQGTARQADFRPTRKLHPCSRGRYPGSRDLMRRLPMTWRLKHTPDGHSGRESGDSRLTHPHSPTVAGAAQDWVNHGFRRTIGAKRGYRHLISRLTPANAVVGAPRNERGLYTGAAYERPGVLRPTPEKMLNDIQYAFLAVDFSELLNIVSAWKSRLTASTRKSVSWRNCARSYEQATRNSGSNSCRQNTKTNA